MTDVTVRDLMTPDVLSLQADDTLTTAREAMGRLRIRHIPVVDGQRKVIGLITQRDVLAATVSVLANLDLNERNSLEDSILVGEVMTAGVRTIDADSPLRDAVDQMLEHKWGCMPVVTGDRLAGILTESDFLKLVLKILDGETL